MPNEEHPPSEAEKKPDEVDDFRMPLWEHLDDLRNAIIRSLLALCVGLIVTYNFSDQIVYFLQKPLLDLLPAGEKHLYFTGIADKFVVYFKISCLAAAALTSPFILYQIWNFIAPALYKRERRMVVPFVFAGTFAFLVGLAFAYYMVIPMCYGFLINFGTPNEKAIITLTEYFDLTLKLLVGVGAIFELPVVMMILGRFGIITHKMLSRFRRQAILINAVIAAIVTPSPDAVTMLVVMIPLCLLYEISIIGVRWTGKSRQSSESTDS